jgi:hypothetical protein
MKFKRWLEKQPRDRPFLSVLFVMLLIVVPGYFRVESAVDEANRTADQLADKIETDRILSCQTRNTFQRNSRNKFTKYNDAIELAIIRDPSDPERVAAAKVFMENLRAAVETTAEQEDLDCNGDEVFDAADYLP